MSKYADLYDLRNRITKRLVCHVSFWGREQYYFKNLLGPGVWYTDHGKDGRWPTRRAGVEAGGNSSVGLWEAWGVGAGVPGPGSRGIGMP